MTETSTQATFSAIASAFESGNVGLAIGLILLTLINVLRVTKFTGLFDSARAVLIASVITFVGTFGNALVAADGNFLAAIGPALTAGLPVLLSLFVKPTAPDPK